ncbi:winged helix-turn-helix domain-containing protein [Marinicella marina]|uniref:winged helix-turn-helix domain-containing protein n=1 Tax=Marinicella marina TaxID=2996016 RepID=UPI002260A4C1|nr:winged helix-turn-helix domain-containing protein [Marinicella marina]
MNNIYKIKHISIDFDDHKLTSNGVEMSIDYKAIEVLRLMVERANETITTDDFMEQIWRDKPSSPEVIPAAIARLRKVFKKAGISDDLIVTVHKVGYRFEPPPEQPVMTTTQSKKHPVIQGLFLVLIIGALLGSMALNIMYYMSNLPDDKVAAIKAAKIAKESESDVTQIYILRHTEKTDDFAEDPLLSERGIERAKYWKKVLQHIEFDRVFTTDFKRNIMTAELIADASTVQPDLYYPMSFDVLKFINQIRGQKVLVIGHSNTIPDMVNRLIDETKYPPMSHENYNILYVVNINKDGATSSSMLHIELP